MIEPELAAAKRKAGIASAVILATSAVGSWISFFVYAYKMPIFPTAAVVILTIIVAGCAALALWLGRAVWTADGRWPVFALLMWAISKEILPNLLYPSVFPRIMYILAASAAIMAIARRDKVTA